MKYAVFVLLCLSCCGLPLLEARALRGTTAAAALGHAEDAAASVLSSFTMVCTWLLHDATTALVLARTVAGSLGWN
jgi:hypothetical protein